MEKTIEQCYAIKFYAKLKNASLTPTNCFGKLMGTLLSPILVSRWLKFFKIVGKRWRLTPALDDRQPAKVTIISVVFPIF